MMEFISFLNDYGGVLIGFILLAIGVYLLPSKVRWYVATAGIAVLGFRAWQIYTTKERFKAWDEKQQQLLKESESLKDERDKLVAEVDTLKDKQAELIQTRDNLQQKSNQLAEQGKSMQAERQQLSQELAKAEEAAKQTDAKIAHLKNATAIIDKTEALLKDQVAATNHEVSDEALMKLAQGIK